MGITKTLGGDRVGSGNRMKVHAHGFGRSNKNLSTTFASTMAPGVLYPCYTNIALDGDTFDIDLNAFVRTIQTNGPLYGSFKLQIDFYQIAFRLYQGILHNNTIDIARKMNQVYLPKIQVEAMVEPNEFKDGFKTQINETALLRYTNLSGIGTPVRNVGYNQTQQIAREILAIPTLAYYDIFKNYYANKQEDYAYVITPSFEEGTQIIQSIELYQGNTFKYAGQIYMLNDDTAVTNIQFQGNFNKIIIKGKNLNPDNIYMALGDQENYTVKEVVDTGVFQYYTKPNNNEIILYKQFWGTITFEIKWDTTSVLGTGQIKLTEFPLSNIDDMRKYLLTQWDLGTKVVIDMRNQNYLPYSTITGYDPTNTMPLNRFAMNGLVVKTYQSDLFNNWLNTEWVNEITQDSAIDTSAGSFTIDMLNFKKKLYQHLNRLALSGGTYDDWQEMTYGQKAWGKTEKPVYCGGMSSEITFDEVVSTAASETNSNGNQPLGQIAGRGTLEGRKGGHITIKVGEASLIMGIVSITPRLFYTQGNAWYNTELDTMDDLHKPIFDRIGFQDLMVEQMAWWDTQIQGDQVVARSSAGKQPAWMNYATDIDRAYGDFAKKDGISYMILSRNYEQDEQGNVADVTTYIDPEKYNYPFAVKTLDAQNFWTFIKIKVHARRQMSNTQIPNT